MALQNLISGSGQAPDPSGSTAFGLYDEDLQFIEDAKSTAKWVATKLGWPIMQVELQWKSVYDCFEEATSEYSSLVNNSNMKNWMLNYMGTPTGSRDYTHKFPNNRFNFLKRHADSVASEVGVGGNIDWKTGSIDLQEGKQDYDLQQLYGAVSESNKRLDIKEVWHYRTSSPIAQSYAFGGQEFINQEFPNLGSVASPSRTLYYVFPTYSDILRAEALELSDTIRKSSYSYEIINNKLKIFPVPNESTKLFFRYTTDDSNDPISSDDTSDSSQVNGVSDVSNVPYEFMQYSTINSMGKQWIRKYALALSKELLGNIRRKYDTVPIPENEVNLDGNDLISDARDEKQKLKEDLDKLLEETSTNELLNKESQMQDNLKNQMDQFPLLPYVK